MSSCPACGAPIEADDRFCESCGASLTAPAAPAAPEAATGEPATADGAVADARTHALPAPPAPDLPARSELPVLRRCSCGGEIDADGWCTVCGMRAVDERAHYSDQAAPNVAAVSDRGRVHSRNEDASALAVAGDRVVIVVCDGVTSTTDSEVAAVAAAGAARDVLASAADPPSRQPGALVDFWTDRLADAVVAAQAEAVAAAAEVGAHENPPSCTFVAAVVDGPVLVAGWVGDSRCYWFGDDGTALQVSVDDSWASAQIATGTAREVAEQDPRAHSITRWLGVDSPVRAPSSVSVRVDAGGWVLVCSDGLWNYCSAPDDLRRLLLHEIERAGDAPVDVAAALCDWANEQGGHDNVTVALGHLAPTAPTIAVGAAEPAAEPT